MSTGNCTVRKATSVDVDAIKTLADAQKHELGFVLRPALARSIVRGEILVAENGTGLIGFVEYHHRQDEQTTLYHIAVVPDFRRQGVGRALVEAMRDEALAFGKQVVRLKCPVDLPAQEFYAQLGFKSAGEEFDKSRPLVVWLLPLA